MTPRVKPPPFFSVPDTMAEDLLAMGIPAEGLGLVFEAWQVSGRNQLDGKLTFDRAKRLGTWDEAIAHDLVIVGAFESADGYITLIGYLEGGLNKTREQIAALREKQIEGGRKGGLKRAADAPRLPDGTLAVTKCPVHDQPWRPSKHGGEPYCTAKAGPGEGADRRGYCGMTPSGAKVYLGVTAGPYTYTYTDTDTVSVRTDGTDVAAPSENSMGERARCSDCGRVWVTPADEFGIDTVNDVAFCRGCAGQAGWPSWLRRYRPGDPWPFAMDLPS
jgi:hypothetical protein